MDKKLALLGFTFLCITTLMLNRAFASSTTSQYQHLSSVESDIVSRINGTNIYNYDLELEKIALDHNQSLFSFRSSGSVGANATATWIRQQFESFGLETQTESYQFTTWNLLAPPLLKIDTDGNPNTTNDQVQIPSFQCEHLCWPTSEGGVFARLVTLPLPYDPIAWNEINTTGKVLLIDGEVQSDRVHFTNKLETQTPAAIIFVSSSDRPLVFSPSAGGNFWGLEIPVGWVTFDDGQLIQGKMTAENASALVSVRAVVGLGPHYNVVAKLPGSLNPEKEIIISAHYDSVLDAAFSGDGAGASAVLELAKVFSEAAQEGIYKPQYTLVFIAFAGGDLGLAGSVNYVKEHASELSNIAAVINLDSLGSNTTVLTRTFPDDIGLDLQSVAMSASNDLNVTINLINLGTRNSDQEAFRDPVDTDDSYMLLWGTGSGIRNMTRVKSSIMIGSTPLTWVNTENDNSTSYSKAGFIDALESQARVAGLTTMRVLSTIFSPFLLELYGSVAAVVVAAAVAAYFMRSRLKSLYQGFAQEVNRYIGPKEVLYIIILTVIFLFLSFALRSTVGEAEVINDGYPTIATIQYFGAPFAMIGIVSAIFATESSAGGSRLGQSQAGGVTVLYGGLLLNIALFLLAAFVITYAAVKLKYARELNAENEPR